MFSAATGLVALDEKARSTWEVWHDLGVSLSIAAGLLIACVVLAILPRRDVHGRGLALLRCFFPSWRFFEQIEPGPSLQVRCAPPGQPFGPWRDAWTPAPRTAAALIVNARGNLELAYQSLVDQLWSERQDAPEDPGASITYQLVRRLVEVECLQPVERAPGSRYCFGLGVAAPDQAGSVESKAGGPASDARSNGGADSQAFVSTEHEIGAP